MRDLSSLVSLLVIAMSDDGPAEMRDAGLCDKGNTFSGIFMSLTYFFTQLHNTVWEDMPYFWHISFELESVV